MRRAGVPRLSDSAHGLLLIGVGAGACFAVAVLAGSLVLARGTRRAAPPVVAGRVAVTPDAATAPAGATPGGAGAWLEPAAPFDRRLLRPVDVPDQALRDSFREPRGQRAHRAVDIAAPRGFPVRAVDDGTILRLARTGPAGIAVDHLDPSGRYCYFYAHLAAHAPGLAAGQSVRRGQVIGYVGTTGNAPPQAPHLHFAIFRAGGRPRACGGVPINPFPLLRPGPAPGSPGRRRRRTCTPPPASGS